MRVRDARESDLPAIAEIYNYEVLHGTATFDTDTVDVVNSILWNETRFIQNEQIVGGTVSVRSSCIRWMPKGMRDNGNTDENPRFIDPEQADYRLGPARGSASGVLSGVALTGSCSQQAVKYAIWPISDRSSSPS